MKKKKKKKKKEKDKYKWDKMKNKDKTWRRKLNEGIFFSFFQSSFSFS